MTYHDPLHIPSARLVVEYDENKAIMLNKALLDQQNCWTNLEEIKEVHWLKMMIYDLIEKETDDKMIKSLAQDLTLIEFHLQELWGFELDAAFHRFWEYPKCSCPQLDNRDSYPNLKYINLSCKLHGDD